MKDKKKAEGQNLVMRELLNSIEDQQMEGEVKGHRHNNNIVHPIYNQAGTDAVYTNGYNSWIVLGRDRANNLQSGYGSENDPECASVDIVAGRASGSPMTVDEKTNKKVLADVKFPTDAARVLVSQKTDVDDNFKLVKGNVGNRREKSAVVLNADGVRIIGNEGIKLVTRVKNYDAHKKGVATFVGVDIIAGNDDTNLQPMVLGNNLVEALNGIIDQLNKITSTVSGLVESQLALGIALGSHTHTGGTIFGMTGPSIEAALQSIPVVMKDMCMTFDNVTTKLNSEVERFKTLNKASSANILSDHNRVN